jgi:hypothetical protein
MNFFYPRGRAPEPLTEAFAIARILCAAKRQKRIPVHRSNGTGRRAIGEQGP